MSTKTFEVKITHKGSERAKPAIWYAGMSERTFEVIKSIQYPSSLEVVSGKFYGKLIDQKDCLKIN